MWLGVIADLIAHSGPELKPSAIAELCFEVAREAQ